MNKIKLIAFIQLVLIANIIKGEDAFNPLRSAVPSLTIAPDARGSSMGDIGGATEADIFSQHWNPAKYPFAYSKTGVSFAFTPWLKQIADDINLSYLCGYTQLSNNLAVGSSLRYFSLGDITLSDPSGIPYDNAHPYEFALDASVSLKFSERFAGAVALRYIHSDLGIPRSEAEKEIGQSVAADIAGYYNSYLILGNNECLLGLGFNISNIGNKISYDNGDRSIFLPTNLRLGTSLLFPLDSYNTLSLNIDINKYLIPTPPLRKNTETEEKYNEKIQEYYDTPFMKGMLKSFSDAPGGIREELQEITWAFGTEYAYNNQFFVRSGYSHESPYKGNRQYFSLGTGFKLTSFQIDVSYLVSTVSNSPLDQTLRFSLSFNMEGLQNLMKQ